MDQENDLSSYAGRLASAMEEAGFPSRGGQSKLGRAIGCTSQTVNQAIKGQMLSALYHVRACIRMGVRPLWLVEGRGPRYDPAGPRTVVPGEEEPAVVPLAWIEGHAAEQGGTIEGSRGRADACFADLDLSEQAIVTKLRKSKTLRKAVATLVDMADVSRG